MWLKALLAGLALLWAAAANADNYVVRDALGNFVVLPCTTANGVCTPVYTSGSSTTDQEVVGNVANDAVDAGNPLKNGGVANSSLPSAVAAGDRVNAYHGLSGQYMVGIVGTTSSVGADDANQSALFTSIGNGQLTPIGSAGYVYDGTNWDRQRGPAGTIGSTYVENGPYTATRVTADGQIKATAGFVHEVCIMPTTDAPTGGLMSLYNSASETGTVVFSKWVRATSEGLCATLDTVMSTGIYVGYDATLANASVTVTFR